MVSLHPGPGYRGPNWKAISSPQRDVRASIVRALVIGVDKYGGGLRPLKNGVNDAYAMMAKLE